jgi:hypothetical protein
MDGVRVYIYRAWESSESAAYHARRLVHDNTWASMATTSKAYDGIAYANIVSYSGTSSPRSIIRSAVL